MKIIKPYPNIPATKVESWNQIKEEIKKLYEFVHKGEFDGFYKEAYAISHTQVSMDPKNFFVINDKIFGGQLKKDFGSSYIVNLKILEESEPVEFEEACMSFPHRKPKKHKRFYKIKVEYQIPIFNKFLRKKTKTFISLPSYICQHESEHQAGRSIYFK